jgi:hypothetical protein
MDVFNRIPKPPRMTAAIHEPGFRRWVKRFAILVAFFDGD